MGYSYGYGPSGRMLLSCDNCGEVGGVRRRTCPHKVLGSSLRGPRYSLPYCPAPALCVPCWVKLGRNHVHDRCVEGAAASQARYDAEQARLDAGDARVTTRWGSWAEGVPDGHYRATYVDVHGMETTLILPDGDGQPNWLSEVQR